MISIRLAKIGKKNRPAYRIVVANKRSGRDNPPLEILGNFDPYQRNSLKINTPRVEYWRKQGAEVSQAVQKILDQKYEFKAYSGSAKVEKGTTT